MDEGRRSRVLRRVLFPSTNSILVTLLAVDTFLIGGHVLHDVWGHGPFSLVRLSLAYEGGFATQFGVAKLLTAAGIMWLIARRTLAPIDVAWAFTLVIVALDDLLMIHEGLGGLFVAWFDLPGLFGRDPLPLGELIVWASMGSVVLVLLFAAHKRSPLEARKRSLRIAGLVALLAFFAVVVDAANSFLFEGSVETFTLPVEDGGELIVMTLILAYAASAILEGSTANHRNRDGRLGSAVGRG